MSKNIKCQKSKKFPIVWARVHQKANVKYIGICGYAWKPFFGFKEGDPSFDLQVCILHDLYINEETRKCEEETRCLNLSCVFNKTSVRSFAYNLRPSSADCLAKALKNRWKVIVEHLHTWTSIADQCKKAYQVDPTSNVFDFDDKDPK